MDNFIVSARKYRPATFNTVVGQAHITNTLKNAINTNHLAQAFLFCGPRGVGKTTCARILAKTINCTNKTAETEACDQCDSCLSFNSGASLNVYELDAASNNTVDDIRNLVDQVRFAPQLGTHKVYIIDEVHMLSNSAFNAFLKTLEEPPKHAIFILATTEKHKIIPTILSRCQIFDFNRIQIEDIANHLAFIAKSEGVTAETDALHIIAQKADGALRDACSIFDQIVSFAGNNVTYKAVIENLNILDYDYYFKVTDAILSENISQSLLVFNEILNNGFDGHNFIAGMGSHFRNLLVGKDSETLQLLEVGSNIKDKYKEQAQKCSLSFLVKGLTVLNKADLQYKNSKNQRLQVELALMQLCSLNGVASAVAEAEKKNDISQPQPPVNSTTVAKSISAPVVNPTTNTIASTSATVSSSVQSVVKKPLLKTSSPSISQRINSEKQNEATEVKETSFLSSERPQQPVNQLLLDAAWQRYASDLRAKGKQNLAIVLTSKQPVLGVDNLSIEFVINNKAAEEALNEDKTEFLSFLRKELNNYSIQLNIVIAQLEEGKNLYTATDRYKHLSEKNPSINKLRQAFDLDIEF